MLSLGYLRGVFKIVFSVSIAEVSEFLEYQLSVEGIVLYFFKLP